MKRKVCITFHTGTDSIILSIVANKEEITRKLNHMNVRGIFMWA